MRAGTSSTRSAGTIGLVRPFARAVSLVLVSAVLLTGFFLSSCQSEQPRTDTKAVRRASGDGVSGGAPVGAGDLYALVVGVSKYRNPKIQELKRADKDARDFGEFLKTQNKLFRRSHIRVLCNDDATRARVVKHLSYGMRRAGKNDTVILFFSGHGAKDSYYPEEVFFLTHDTDPDNLNGTAVKMNGLRFLKRIDADRVVLIADACHAGGFSQFGTKGGPLWKELMREVSASSGKVMITSSRPDEVSIEKPGMENSVFTHYLLEGLKGMADKDRDGLVTAQEAYDYTYRLTKDETAGRQHPQFESGRMVGLFPISIVGDMHASLAPAARPSSAGKPSRSGAILVLKTHPGKVRVRIGSRDAGESGPDGLLVAPGVATGVEHELKLEKQGFGTKTVAVTIPKGNVHEYREIGLEPARVDRSGEDYENKVKRLVSLWEKGDWSTEKELERMYRDPDAVKWFRQAAQEGNALAQFNLGRMYFGGFGVRKDDSEGLQWLRKAANQGYAIAQNSLGSRYHLGFGVMTQDYAEAMKWYKEAAEQGYAPAKFNLGELHFQGLGVTQDYAKAVKWYRKAAEQGYASAQARLCTMYAHGSGVTEDYAEAVNWCRKAEHGSAAAQETLGWLYETGRGVTQDYDEAAKRYRKAAEQGQIGAKKALERLGAVKR